MNAEATHLIKRASQVVTGTLDRLDIYGQDYNTPDGTCIRDYIHVSDLAAAHVAVLDALRTGNNASLTLNCGYGRGFSVREVISAMEEVCGTKIATREAPRRAGDPMCLVADSTAILTATAWRPRHDDLGFIVRTAIEWERRIGKD
jgi:UDP-glucose 4-epimerase